MMVWQMQWKEEKEKALASALAFAACFVAPFLTAGTEVKSLIWKVLATSCRRRIEQHILTFHVRYICYFIRTIFGFSGIAFSKSIKPLSSKPSSEYTFLCLSYPAVGTVSTLDAVL